MTSMRSKLRSREGWKKTKVLGSGGNGTVHLAHQVGWPDAPLAVKSARPRPDAVESLKREAHVLRRLAGAPNVVDCYGEDVSNGVYSLLLEYAPCGTLRDLIRCAAPMDELHVACYTAMLLNGLAHIHSRGFFHCDLKATNVLVFPGSSPVIKQLKISDFGDAVSASEDQEKENIAFDSNTPESEYESDFEESDSVSPDVPDIMKLSDIMIEMICGEGKSLSLDAERKLSPDARDFLLTYASCTAKELLKHPFIESSLKIMSDSYRVDLNLHSKNATPAWISQQNLFSAKPASTPVSCRRSLVGGSMKPVHHYR